MGDLNSLSPPLDSASSETCFGNLIILKNMTLIALNKTLILLNNLKSMFSDQESIILSNQSLNLVKLCTHHCFKVRIIKVKLVFLHM